MHFAIFIVKNILPLRIAFTPKYPELTMAMPKKPSNLDMKLYFYAASHLLAMGIQRVSALLGAFTLPHYRDLAPGS